MSWINKKTGPVSLLLTTVEEIDTFVQSAEKGPVMVFFGTNEEDADFTTFKAFAASQEKLNFGHALFADARTHMQVAENVKVVLFKNFDEKRNDFSGEFTAVELE